MAAGPATVFITPNPNAPGLGLTAVPATTSAGAASAGQVVGLGAQGVLDPSMMPTGIVAPTAQIVTSEALSGGNLVNVYNNSGTANVRKADASAANAGKAASGFVLSSYASGATATVYFGDPNNAVTGLTPGPQFLSGTTPGAVTSTAPSTSGYLVQPVGVAVSPTVLVFNPQSGYQLG